MTGFVSDDTADDATDAWVVAAGRELGSLSDDTLSDDAGRLAAKITASLGRVRRPGRPLDTDTPGVRVSDRVVKQVLSMRIRSRLGRLVVYVSIDGDDGAVDRIRIGLIARYRDVLPVDADRVRDITAAVLLTHLGPQCSAAVEAIDVRWQDIETREWAQ